MNGTSSRRFVAYSTKNTDDGKFAVEKEIIDYSIQDYSKQKKTIAFPEVFEKKWNADYAAELLRSFERVGKEAMESVNELKSFKPEETLDHLAYSYCRDSLGAGWSISNGHRLTDPFVIDIWLFGVGPRFGYVDPIAAKVEDIHNALAEAIHKCLRLYRGE